MVSRRTGLSPDVIRVWERRYAAIVPARSDNRRRLYSDEDVQRLMRLQRALEAGRRIGEVAGMSCAELDSLIETDRDWHPPANGASTVSSPPPMDEQPQVLLDEALAAVRELDDRRLSNILARAGMAFSIPVLLESLLAPLLAHIGDDWRTGNLRVCHERLATSVIRTFLCRLEERCRPSVRGPVILFTTPVGHPHEIAVLMAGVVATCAGWTSVYLGPEIPVDEMAYACMTTRARALAIGLGAPHTDSTLDDALRRLASLVPAGVQIVAGGASARAHKATLDEIGARLCRDFRELDDVLEQMRSDATRNHGR